MHSKAVGQLNRHTGVLFNLMFGAYILFLQPLVAPRFEAKFSESHATDWLLAILLIGAGIMEVYGSRLKIRHINTQAAKEQKIPDVGGGFLFLFIIRMVIGSMLMMFVVQALNLDPRTHVLTALGLWGFFLGRELVIFFSLPHSLVHNPTSQYPSWVADLLILPFTCLAYTSFWGVLFTRQKPLLWTASNTGEVAGYVFAASLLFLIIVFLPLRTIYLFEEITLANTRRERSWIALSTILTAVLAGVSLVEW